MSLIQDQINPDDGLPSPSNKMMKRRDFLMQEQETDPDKLEVISDISE